MASLQMFHCLKNASNIRKTFLLTVQNKMIIAVFAGTHQDSI